MGALVAPELQYTTRTAGLPETGSRSPPSRKNPKSANDTWAVVVAFDRDVELDRLLTRLRKQTLPVAGVIVVDNANLQATASLVSRHGGTYIGSAMNMGGAGGFGLGMLMGLARGAQALWLWDDDGYPDNNDCLALLSTCASERGADLACPLVVSEEDASRTAFTVRLAGTRTKDRIAVQKRTHLDGFANLFNGALIQAAVLGRVGLPDFRLFIRGDEVDFGLRVKRSGGLVVTCTAAIARHPSGDGDTARICGTPFSVLIPANPERRHLTFRNRAYVFSRRREWLHLFSDPLRYGVFFLLRPRPDLTGFKEWWRATLLGYRGAFGAPLIKTNKAMR